MGRKDDSKYMRWRRHTPLRFRNTKTFILIACVLIYLFWSFRPIAQLRRRRYDVWRDPPIIRPLPEAIRHSVSSISSETRCKGFPPGLFDKVQIVVKVGAPEVRTKLARQLATNTACVRELLVFSDYEEVYEDVRIYDALGNLPLSYWHNNSDYDIYKANTDAKDSGKTLGRSSEGWKLDKYKFLPMMDLTYDLEPDKDWYVFIEADTYVFWDNLFRFLQHQDPRKALYIGSPIWRHTPPEPTFGHGGSGIILSRSALRRLVHPEGKDKHPIPGSTQFGVELEDKCCGDATLADMFDSRGISLRGYWPMVNGEKHHTVRFGDRWNVYEQWCEPIVTLHHINETDMNELWEWEMRRDSTAPVTFEELYWWLKPQMPEYRRDWTIYPELDVVKLPDPMAASPEACQQGCRDKYWCYQWQHRNDTCEQSPWIRVGKEELPDKPGNTMVSGTIFERVEQYEKRMGHCKDAHWVHANP